ncbi:MarR family winged helix-turn-helix transcriptional regulator [Actinomadura flavalba]|uniref:MarR family winged helix-turn-helix transcriptional regulator n=1 Tax=Actinomadura flavalba TaxID=1120938 RepID=UPI00037FD894|nr:MarR family transcriptional regulator [Actinomadura flavalba]
MSDDAPPEALRSLASWLLTQTAAHAHRLVTDGLGAIAARGHHYRLLASLDEFGPASQATLARHSGVHTSDVVAALNELSAAGHTARLPDPADRRRNIITLTPSGRTHLTAMRERLQAVQEDLLRPLDATERATLTTLLTRLLAHHENRERESRHAG